MPRPNSTLRAATLTLVFAGVATTVAGQRVVLPSRIGWKDEFGGSKFAEALHNLSERGELDGTVRQPQIDPGAGYTTPPWRPYHNHAYLHWNPCDDGRVRYPYGIDGRLRYGVQPASRMTMPAPAASPQPAAPPPAPPTLLERARHRFAAGDEEIAIEHYRSHLREHTDDFEAAAELASALFAAGRADDGVAMFRLAYGSDPGLATRPISDRLTLETRAWRSMVVRAVRHAHKRDSGSAWLAVGVLMQAEGRPRVALRMLERAERHGLDRAVSSPLAAAMR